MTLFTPKLIHVTSIQVQNQGKMYLYLRQIEPFHYLWFQPEGSGAESETPIRGGTVEEAMIAANNAWKGNEIRTLHCGFRYTLPERDEVGTNALFHQMIASYSSMSGVYFDEDLRANCIVHFASNEARHLWKQLQQTGRL